MFNTYRHALYHKTLILNTYFYIFLKIIRVGDSMKFLKKSLKILIITIFLSIFLITGLYLYARTIPKLDINNTGSYYLYDINDELFFQGNGTSKWANLNEISDYVKKATIVVEDKDFYNHHGFNIPRIIKAMYVNLINRDYKQGASTITQQFAKNLYLEFDKTWKRKLNEVWYTIQIETHYNKDDILEGYLNTINYGQGNMGIVNASSYYFNKKPSELTLEEAIMLAGIPKNPAGYNPVSNYEASLKRAWVVAKSMLNNGYIDEDTYNNLFKEKLEIFGQTKNNNLQMIMYYQEAVLNELSNIKKIPASLINAGGLKIYTTLDLKEQTSLENNILSNKVDDELQVASVIVDPKTGAVKALTGGMNYAKSQYNRALKSKRQVGSTMKPFLYYAALENNMTMSSSFRSEETTFNIPF